MIQILKKRKNMEIIEDLRQNEKNRRKNGIPDKRNYENLNLNQANLDLN